MIRCFWIYCNPTGYSDDEGEGPEEGEGGPLAPPRASTPPLPVETTSDSTSAAVEAEAAEAVVVKDEPIPKCREGQQGYDQDTRAREIETLTKGMLTSRSMIDFVFHLRFFLLLLLFILFFPHCKLSVVILPLLPRTHCIFVRCAALSSNRAVCPTRARRILPPSYGIVW
jgi:hypothetical protein